MELKQKLNSRRNLIKTSEYRLSRSKEATSRSQDRNDSFYGTMTEQDAIRRFATRDFAKTQLPSSRKNDSSLQSSHERGVDALYSTEFSVDKPMYVSQE